MVRSLDGVFYQAYNKISPYFEFLSSPYGVLSPWRKIWAAGNKSESFLSYFSRIKKIFVRKMLNNKGTSKESHDPPLITHWK